MSTNVVEQVQKKIQSESVQGFKTPFPCNLWLKRLEGPFYCPFSALRKGHCLMTACAPLINPHFVDHLQESEIRPIPAPCIAPAVVTFRIGNRLTVIFAMHWCQTSSPPLQHKMMCPSCKLDEMVRFPWRSAHRHMVYEDHVGAASITSTC